MPQPLLRDLDQVLRKTERDHSFCPTLTVKRGNARWESTEDIGNRAAQTDISLSESSLGPSNEVRILLHAAHLLRPDALTSPASLCFRDSQVTRKYLEAGLKGAVPFRRNTVIRRGIRTEIRHVVAG